jgi:hypothetical protein
LSIIFFIILSLSCTLFLTLKLLYAFITTIRIAFNKPFTVGIFHFLDLLQIEDWASNANPGRSQHEIYLFSALNIPVLGDSAKLILKHKFIAVHKIIKVGVKTLGGVKRIHLKSHLDEILRVCANNKRDVTPV